jgi:hypothetical protein
MNGLYYTHQERITRAVHYWFRTGLDQCESFVKTKIYFGYTRNSFIFVQTKHINEMKNYRLKIEQDTHPDNPRSWDNLGTMVCFHRRYDLGDDHRYCSGNYDGWEEMEEDIIKNEDVHTILPLYLYDHSGITISTSPFSCNWDSGQIGFIFVSKDKVKKEYIKDIRVEDILKGEVETYDQYLTGDVWGYKVYEVTTCSLGHEHEHEVESCWGFYGEEECRREGEGVMNYLMEKEFV